MKSTAIVVVLWITHKCGHTCKDIYRYWCDTNKYYFFIMYADLDSPSVKQYT